jgi:tetratricopeptide (TPR) repeat protein
VTDHAVQSTGPTAQPDSDEEPPKPEEAAEPVADPEPQAPASPGENAAGEPPPAGNPGPAGNPAPGERPPPPEPQHPPVPAAPETGGRRREPSPAREPGPGLPGRRRELDQLHADLERAGLHTLSGRPAPHARVLLIAGRPGSGRTTLAEEFVRQVAGRFPDGVLRAGLTDPGGTPVPIERTARDLLAALHAAPAPAGAGEEELAATLRAALAGRRVLLLLDDVAQPRQLLDLLPDTRGCLVLAVSEGPLTGVPQVRPCTLGGLERSVAVEMLARCAAAPRREHRIAVDPRSAELVAEACGHLPAALALAGGWLAARPMLSVVDGARQLGQLGQDDPVERAFRLVHDSLSRQPARVLRMLALAPDGLVDAHTASALAGCSVAAAEGFLSDFLRLGLLRPSSVAPGCYAVPGCLDPLLRAELAARERPEETLLAKARMLERIVRQLRACHAITEPEDSPAHRRLACTPRSLRFRSPAQARDWLETRRPAVLAAARLAVAEADGKLDTLARRLISGLARAFDAHRSPEEAAPELYRLHELVLGVAERGGLHRERTAALLNLGDLDARTGRHSRALARYRAALETARKLSDQLAAGRALESIGGTYEDLGDWARAADWYGRALALHQARDARVATARLHGRLGAVHTYAGAFGEALREWRAAAAAFRRLPDARAHARALSEVARVQEYAGRPRESLRTAELALEAAKRARDERLRAALLLRLADACERAGEVASGRAHRSAAEQLLRVLDADGGRARTTGNGSRGGTVHARVTNGNARAACEMNI